MTGIHAWAQRCLVWSRFRGLVLIKNTNKKYRKCNSFYGINGYIFDETETLCVLYCFLSDKPRPNSMNWCKWIGPEIWQGKYMHQAYAPSEDSRTPPTPYLGLSPKKPIFWDLPLNLKQSFSTQKNRCPSEYAPSSLRSPGPKWHNFVWGCHKAK